MSDYQNQTLNIVRDSNVLKPDDFDIIFQIKEELQDTFQYAQVFRTRTEMEASILNDMNHPNADSKYWQAVREQNVMYHELVMLSYEYRKNGVEIRQLKRKLENETDELEQELIQIEIERKEFIAINQQKTAKDRIREISEWHDIKQKLIPNMQNSLTDVNEHQLLSYTTKWIQEFVSSNGASFGSLPERNNLLSQLDKGLKLCKERGIEPKLFELFGKENILSLTNGGEAK